MTTVTDTSAGRRHARIQPAVVATATAALALLLVMLRYATATRAVPTRAEAILMVDVAPVRTKPMPVLLESVGQVVSEHTVQVRPQVSGMLRRVYFSEGHEVAAGQRLFQIEAAPFEAALTATRAAWQSARGNAARLVQLEKQHYVTPQDLINARAVADQTEAAYRQAKISLGYTDIRAPIAGRTGALAVKAGNVVGPADAAPLVTINEVRPIQVQFNIPQRSLPLVRERQALQSVRAVITRDDGTTTLDDGSLVFIDNAVNTSTGTVLLKARVPNRREQLWPGQYVGVHLQLSLDPNSLVVPQTAIQTGQSGTYVYLLIDGKATIRPVRVDREIGAETVISSGLSGSEQVIVRVPRGLRSGTRVAPADAPLPVNAAVALPSAE